ncbi:MAG TPA: outer membrane protein assembly factor BamD [Candidatus Polarisedimenticolia bacterium]|nr:outer membrane protein assembly factor BamD [Candidatus Polarisedimenticolia bacterium]
MLTGTTRLRVRYPETDAMGVVHHTHYLVWFEIGRTELMREAGCSYAEIEKEGIWLPVIEASCRYHSPARYDDEVQVVTRLEEITRVTARFTYRVERPSDGRLLATGGTRHAATDAGGVPRRMPERLAGLLGMLLLLLGLGLGSGCAQQTAKAPKDKFAGMTAEQIFAIAADQLESGKHARARDTLQKVLGRQDLAQDLVPRVHLALADAYFNDGGLLNLAEALSRYTNFLTFYPNHERADYAQYQIGICYLKQALNPDRDQGQTLKALAELKKVRSRFPNSEWIGPAAEKADEARERLAEHDFRIGYFYFRRKEYQGAVDRLRDVLEAYPGYSRKDRLYYVLGRSLMELNKPDEGRLYLEKLVAEFPGSRHAADARDLLARPLETARSGG